MNIESINSKIHVTVKGTKMDIEVEGDLPGLFVSITEVIHSITKKMIEMGIKEEDIKNAFDKIFKSGMDKAWKI